MHFHPPGTPGHLCHLHNRAALSTVIAAVARRRGLGPDITDAQIIECAEAAKDTSLKKPASAETLAAVRAALRPPLARADGAQAVSDAVFASLPASPVRVIADDGQEFFLVPIPAT